MPVKKEKEKKIMLKLAIILFCAIIFFSSAKNTQAALWPGVDPQITNMLTIIRETVQGIVMGAAKQAAYVSLNAQLNTTMGSANMFITNYDDYLVGQPEAQSITYINDYISQLTRGRGTLSGYASEGFGVNYMAQLEIGAKSLLDNGQLPKPTYEGDPSQMFVSGNFKNLSSYLSGINNPWAFNTYVDQKYQEDLENRKIAAQTKAMASGGFVGTGESKGQGDITYPGSLIKENAANIQDLGNKIVAGAQSLPEIITAVVSQTMTRSMQQGFSGVARNVQREINDVQSKINGQIQINISNSGPGARF